MSMNGKLKRATDTELARLRAHPEELRAFLTGPPDAFEDRSDLDLDKAWHGLHFLLTGTDWEGDPPLNVLAAGGEELGGEDVGYGPVRALTGAEVRRLAAALTGIAPDDLRARFDPERMTDLEIYPDIWDRDDERDETLEWLLDAFERLKALVSAAARDGTGLLVYVT